MSNNNNPHSAPLVVGIAGSLRAGSLTSRAVVIALEGAAASGARTELLNLQDYDLPFAGDDAEDNAGVARLQEHLRRADGVILGSPEYHGGMSGVLKNALDLMGFREFEGKMIGLIGVSGGAMGAHHALTSLRTVGRALHAWVIPEQASIPQAWHLFNEEGQLQDEKVRQRLMIVGRQVAHYASLHALDKNNTFLKQWETAPENPGGAPQRDPAALG